MLGWLVNHIRKKPDSPIPPPLGDAPLSPLGEAYLRLRSQGKLAELDGGMLIAVLADMDARLLILEMTGKPRNRGLRDG